ncbi:hypothetical protein NsoK4_05720 [Nitrosopumilus sp. K4]|uniref:HEPN domain-containing protein n=1 Tax=Nitrosopumilus sp. K4 TaxID=2795383 RepID=UPI001BACD9EA|nr:HEPN domain-containing protein [Nitrosopumilus sp. K4]QUC63961.1 hypothetical protein NsoK4_05720 [Nitrosopumilus sp. K4]
MKKQHIDLKPLDEFEQKMILNSPMLVVKLKIQENVVDVLKQVMNGGSALVDRGSISDKIGSEGSAEVNGFLNVLTLFKPWMFTPLFAGPIIYRGFHEGIHAGWTSGTINPKSVAYPKFYYNLTNSEIEELQNFFVSISTFFDSKKNKISNRINFAYSWLKKAREIVDVNDRLIFLTIAIESLMSKETDELSYRISHRTSALLGETLLEKQFIFRNMRKMYKKRSSLVHGVPISIRFAETEFLLEVLRVLILRMMSLSLKNYSDANLLDELLDTIFEPDRVKTILSDSTQLFGSKAHFHTFLTR